jgi:hypothetical protein
MCDDEELLSLRRVVREADESCEPIDSQTAARRLGWPDERTASLLVEAREMLLIWDVRVGGQPSSVTDLELTVEGRRLLRDAETSDDAVARDE